MSIKHRMAPGFRTIEGGLFSTVTKADVGDGAAVLAAKGVTMLGWADPFAPDPALPAHIMRATVAALQTGIPAHYTMPIGNADLRAAIAKKLASQNGIQADPARNVLVTPGSDSGLFYAMYLFLEAGDEVLVPDPSYPNNMQNIQMAGAKSVPVPLRAENGYQPMAADFAAAITPKTKMLVLTNPNNPTSTVFARENMEALAALCVQHDLVCIVDQAFEDMIYDGREMVSMAALSGMWERTVTVFSVSKGMALSGYRVGYLAACDEIMDVLYGAAVSVVGATNTAAQLGVLAAFEDPSFVRGYADIFDARRKVIYDIIKPVPGVKMDLPQSAFLCWMDVSRLGSAAEVSAFLVEEARVMVNEGTTYGKEGAGHLRIVFGCLANDEELYDAFRRIAAALTRLARQKGIA
ncbi:pyridoxal phosphate-dependent aminotransferase [Ruminococcaceae bacterium OttesenSCG-928-O06]|nr:pyridoxal phosphate-dependent aminotransferase [Ruminococcaceae bacterium OttesenSCG-928-O06]